MNSLNIKSFTLSIGVVWAICMLFLGWAAAFGWGIEFVNILSSFYFGFKASFIGGIIGCIWGFVVGIIIGFLISLFYNLFNKKPAKK